MDKSVIAKDIKNSCINFLILQKKEQDGNNSGHFIESD